MPAKTSHSPQRRRPTSGWSSGHGSVSCPADASGPGDQAAGSGRSARAAIAAGLAGAGHPDGHDRGCIGRPSPGRGPRGREREPGPRVARVTDGLGDVPIGLAAARRSVESAGAARRAEGFGEGAELGDERAVEPGAATRRASSGRSRRGRVRSRAMPRRCRVRPAPAPSTQAVIGGRSPSSGLGQLRQPPHRDDPDQRTEGEDREADPPGHRVHRVESAPGR